MGTKRPGGMPFIDHNAKLRILRKNRYAHLTEDQFELLMATCDELGLNPWRDSVWITTRVTETRAEMFVQMKLQALREVAMATGQYKCQIGPFWCGDSGKWKRGWRPIQPPLLARVGVIRNGDERAFWGVAKWNEAAIYEADGRTPTEPWGRMPSFMLAKVAEAMALRKAFPSQLGGIYTDDEISLRQPMPPRRTVAMSAPVSDDTPTSDFLFQKRLVSEFDLGNAVERANVICRMENRYPGMRETDPRAFYATVLNELRSERSMPVV